jgi:fimbrial chaperone protein
MKYILLALLISSGFSYASATLDNTRVIYHKSDVKGKSIKLNNNDNIPYIVQAWTDKGEIHSTPSSADAPFVILPPSFKIKEHTSQLIKLLYAGAPLPEDRESIFYLNVAEIPPLDASEHNTMGVILRNRLKVFYRPDVLGEPDNNTFSKKVSLTPVSVAGKTVIAVKNDSPFYLSLLQGKITCKGQSYTVSANMVAPLSESTQWSIQRVDPSHLKGCEIDIRYVNDYGGTVELKKLL